jgi:hypothetical protein
MYDNFSMNREQTIRSLTVSSFIIGKVRYSYVSSYVSKFIFIYVYITIYVEPKTNVDNLFFHFP